MTRRIVDGSSILAWAQGLGCLCVTAGAVYAQAGTVAFEQKISELAGGFGNPQIPDLAAGDLFGHALASIGDLNGDGVEDLAVGAPHADDGGDRRGALWILFLNSDGTVLSEQRISDTDGGFEGVLNDLDYFGWCVASLGDLDGPGGSALTLAVGAPAWNGGFGAGKVWILFLDEEGFVLDEEDIGAAELDAANGVGGDLDDGDSFGSGVAALGDLDGMGQSAVALAVSAFWDDDGGTRTGAVWILFLEQDGTLTTYQKISNLEGGLGGVLESDSGFGRSLSSLGDLDGSGASAVALAVGEMADDDGGFDQGAVWILFLNSDGTVALPTKISEGNGGFDGVLEPSDLFGHGVAALGDLDGDGIGDLAVGAPHADDGDIGQGALWILLLNADGTVKFHQKVSAIAGGFGGDLDSNDIFGVTVASLGDLDGDGRTDLAVGATGDDDLFTDAGAVWILFGDRVVEVLDAQKISQTEGGFAGALANGDQFGGSVVRVGDVNGDTVPDFAVGAPSATGGGSLWVLLMNADGTVDTEINNNFTSASLCAPGDLDGDNVPDLIVGEPSSTNGGSSFVGAIHFVYLKSNGTIKSSHKISETTGGLGDVLDDGDAFGSSVASLGDLDGSGSSTLALAVGASGDENMGSTDTGAVWILFLDANEDLASAPFKLGISPASSGDMIGQSLADLGDIDGAGPSVRALAVGVPGDDTAGAEAGAFFVLYLSSTGALVSQNPQKKITEDVNGFAGNLEPGDRFGWSLANLGALHSFGALDLAVGAVWDDDAANAAGAVWIASLDTTGTVVQEAKITEGLEGFAGDLDAGDSFGQSLGALGDFDGDGRADLVVGAQDDDDGGTDRGAVWVLYLNDGSLNLVASATWTGNTDSDWTDPSNWSSGVVPTSTISAIIPDRPNDPVISISGQECDSLWIRPGGTLSVSAGMDSLSVSGGATVSGPITGTGELVFVDFGTVAGTSTIDPDVQADADLTFQGGPLSLSGSLTSDANILLASSSDLHVGATCSVNGDLGLDLGSTFDVDVDVLVMGNVTVNGGMTVANKLSMAGALLGTAAGEVTIEGAPMCIDVTAGQVCYGGYIVSNCGAGLKVDSLASASTFELAQGFQGPISISAPGTVSFLTPALVIAGDLTVKAGTTLSIDVDSTIAAGANEIVVEPLAIFDVTGQMLSVSQPTAIEVNGMLNVGAAGVLELVSSTLTVGMGGKVNVDPDGELLLDGSTLVVESGGTLCLAGANASQPATLQGTSSNAFALDLQSGSTLAAKNFVFRWMESSGVVIGSAVDIAAQPFDLRGGLFELPAVGGVLLELERPSPQEFRYLSFEDGNGGAFNVRVPGTSAALAFTNWSGGFAGEAFDDDPSNLLTWGPAENTVVASMSGHRPPAAANTVHVAWATSTEVDCAAFVVERALEPGGTFAALGEIAAAGPSSYVFVDPGAGPKLAYRYRLCERLTHGVLLELGEVVVQPVLPAPQVAKSSPAPLSPEILHRPPLESPEVIPAPAPAPLSVGPGGDFATVEAALAALGSSDSIELELLPGMHAPFEIEAPVSGSVCIVASAGAVIDATRAGVRIAGLARNQSVELVGLVIRAPESHAGIAIEDCAGVVLLQDVEVSGVGDAPALDLSRANAVALQGGRVDGVLRVAAGSHASLNGTRTLGILVAGESLLATSGPTAIPRVEPDSRWIASGPAPLLALAPDCLTVPMEMGRAWLLVSEHLGFDPHSPFAGVMLVDHATLRVVPADGIEHGCAAWSIGPRDGTAYAQALVFEPLAGLRLSNVLRVPPGP